MSSPEDARTALLARLIDHAPLFPPASLDLPEALEEDQRARSHPVSFMLGRFVCPVSRLAELPDLGRGVSVVLGSGVSLQPDPGVDVESVETVWADDLSALPALAPEAYVEVSLDDNLDDHLDEIASLGLRAKVRCGGASVPTIESLSAFVRACAERGIVFKATAGLHHALRTDGEHGFLNLLAAVVFGDEEAALAESDSAAFELDAGEFSWRGRRAPPDELARARRGRLHSIGSCSFFEPVEELESLGILPL